MTAEPATAPNRSGAATDARIGILCMLAAMFAFTVMDALSKQLVQTQAPLQVVWGIYVVQAVIICTVMARRLPRLLVSRQVGLQALRAAFLVATSICYVTGLRYVPLAEAGAIVMLAPLAFTALAVPFLKERVGAKRWAGVAAGFLGALIIIRPGTEAMQVAALLPLAAALLHALYQVVTRFVAREDSVLTTLTYSILFCALIMTPIVPFHWTPMGTAQWGLLAAAGVCGIIAEYALIQSLARASAAVVSPYTYSYLLWTALVGLVVFGERPDVWAVLGAVVIVGSGIYVWRRERAAGQGT
ncbi:MAG: DMT family transporter [Rhodospirillales bacterium]|tara:strand:- start:1837 stop:2739 length:903 start_codon:yes stop_codon:yes gene_type:complete